MIEIDVSHSDNMRFPTDQCCNCGTHEGSIGVVDTTLRGTMYQATHSRLKATFPLPYCRSCRKTAHRVPKGFGIRLVVWICLSIFGLVGVTAIPELKPLGVQMILLIDGALAAALVWGWAAVVTRPRGRQTSYYQPVRIRDFGNVLAFTNAPYAHLVLAANPGGMSLARADIPYAYDRQRTHFTRLRSWMRQLLRPSPRLRRRFVHSVVFTIAAIVFYATMAAVRARGSFW